MTPGRFVVAGSGRCGTGFAARALSLMGLPTGHEAVFDHNTTTSGTRDRWARPVAYPGHEPYREDLAGDSSLAVVGYLHALHPADFRLLHLVRTPYAVVDSWLKTAFFADRCAGRCDPEHPDGAHLETPYARFMAALVPSLRTEVSEIDRAIVWTVRANELAASWSGPARTIGLERFGDDPKTLASTCAWLARLPLTLRHIDRAERVLDELGIGVNAHSRPPVEGAYVTRHIEQMMCAGRARMLHEHATRYDYEVPA